MPKIVWMPVCPCECVKFGDSSENGKTLSIPLRYVMFRIWRKLNCIFFLRLIFNFWRSDFAVLLSIPIEYVAALQQWHISNMRLRRSVKIKWREHKIQILEIWSKMEQNRTETNRTEYTVPQRQPKQQPNRSERRVIWNYGKTDTHLRELLQ